MNAANAASKILNISGGGVRGRDFVGEPSGLPFAFRESKTGGQSPPLRSADAGLKPAGFQSPIAIRSIANSQKAVGAGIDI